MSEQFWVCIIGPAKREELPEGADLPPRSGAIEAVTKMLGYQPECWSGWGTDRKRFEAIQKVWNAEPKLTLTREGLFAYFDQMKDADGKITTTADWLADIGMLIQSEAVKEKVDGQIRQ